MTYLHGQQFYAGAGISTVIADGDFETRSAAGFVWDMNATKWQPLPGAKKKGLPAIGAAKYAKHPTTEVMSFAYDLKDGRGERIWLPSQPNPLDLFAYLARGELFEAHNVGFEWWIWNEVCTRKYGWPPLRWEQCRCSMAKSRAFSLPGGLDMIGDVLNLPIKKDKEGKALLDFFSVPRNPTKLNRAIWNTPEANPEKFKALVSYNVTDIKAEQEVSVRVPDLPPQELAFWQAHERINHRGMQCDIANIENAILIVEQAFEKYNSELATITGGQVTAASQLERLKGWLAGFGFYANSMDEDGISELLRTIPPEHPAYRAVEIRSRVGSAAVKKLYAMRNMQVDGRIYDMLTFNGARTGRSSGAAEGGSGVQPQNFPNSGPWTRKCGDSTCGRYYGYARNTCPYCGADEQFSTVLKDWEPACVDAAIETFSSQSLEYLEYVWGDAFPVIAGSLRGLFTAAPGHELLCSDYSAIEAVGVAALAGEEWRLNVFSSHGKIYEESASKIVGIPFVEYMRAYGYTDEELAQPEWWTRKPVTMGSHHPTRKKIGKVSELASAYGGSVGAWKAFGADEFFNDDEILEKVRAWRTASPMIPKFWKGLEQAAFKAINVPGQEFTYRDVTFFMKGDALFMRFPSGRLLTYHRPRIGQGKFGAEITYETYNSNPKMGAMGWMRVGTFGGRLVENAVQGICNDLLREAILRLEAAGYRVVLHVHDEVICEVPIGFGSVAEMERIMQERPSWAAHWPIRADGGWRRNRYGK